MRCWPLKNASLLDYHETRLNCRLNCQFSLIEFEKVTKAKTDSKTVSTQQRDALKIDYTRPEFDFDNVCVFCDVRKRRFIFLRIAVSCNPARSLFRNVA